MTACGQNRQVSAAELRFQRNEHSAGFCGTWSARMPTRPGSRSRQRSIARCFNTAAAFSVNVNAMIFAGLSSLPPSPIGTSNFVVCCATTSVLPDPRKH